MYTWKTFRAYHAVTKTWQVCPDVFFLPFPRPLSHAHAHTRKNTAGSRDYLRPSWAPGRAQATSGLEKKLSLPCLILSEIVISGLGGSQFTCNLRVAAIWLVGTRFWAGATKTWQGYSGGAQTSFRRRIIITWLFYILRCISIYTQYMIYIAFLVT